MALIDCSECGKRISDKAQACPACGAPVQSGTMPPQAVKSTCRACDNHIEHPPEMLGETIACPHCGNETILVAVQSAGVEQSGPSTEGAQPPAAKKDTPSPMLAAFASGCCIAGLGQLACGQTGKGLVLILVNVVLGLVTGGFALFVTWPLMGIDAYMVAKKLERGVPVQPWEFFPP